MTNPRYRKPTVARISMMTVKEHNWVRRVAPRIYAEWMEAGSRIIRALVASERA